MSLDSIFKNVFLQSGIFVQNETRERLNAEATSDRKTKRSEWNKVKKREGERE